MLTLSLADGLAELMEEGLDVLTDDGLEALAEEGLEVPAEGLAVVALLGRVFPTVVGLLEPGTEWSFLRVMLPNELGAPGLLAT